MYFKFEKVNDYNLIAPAVNIIYSQNAHFVSTSNFVRSDDEVERSPAKSRSRGTGLYQRRRFDRGRSK